MKAWLCALLGGVAFNVYAQNPDDYRGGWIADVDGVRQVYLLVVTGTAVSGSYCTDCSNPANLVIVDDGKLDKSGVHFSVYIDNGTTYIDNGTTQSVETATGQLDGKELVLQRGPAGGVQKSVRLHRSPFVAVKAAPPGGFEPIPKAYVPPVTPGTVSTDKVIGLWLAGNGPGKQNFIFKRHKNGIRGMVCGPCIDTANMAVLENVRMDGDKLHFDIAHEDSGPGIVEHGPHKNVTTATIARNEMHLWVVPSFEPATFRPVEMTLLGPVSYQP
jgi:hypothetical protein